jgi:hypothetical protein
MTPGIALPRAPIMSFRTVVRCAHTLDFIFSFGGADRDGRPVATTQSTIPGATFLTLIERSQSNVSALLPSGLFNRAHGDSWPTRASTGCEKPRNVRVFRLASSACNNGWRDDGDVTTARLECEFPLTISDVQFDTVSGAGAEYNRPERVAAREALLSSARGPPAG